MWRCWSGLHARRMLGTGTPVPRHTCVTRSEDLVVLHILISHRIKRDSLQSWTSVKRITRTFNISVRWLILRPSVLSPSGIVVLLNLAATAGTPQDRVVIRQGRGSAYRALICVPPIAHVAFRVGRARVRVSRHSGIVPGGRAAVGRVIIWTRQPTVMFRSMASCFGINLAQKFRPKSFARINSP